MPAPRRFNIRLWFGGADPFVILAIALAFGVSMSGFLTERLLAREAEASQEFLQSVILAERTGGIVFVPSTPVGAEALASFTSHIVDMPGILRANIYAPERRIVWSTDVQLVGRRFDINHELDEALRGMRVTEVGTPRVEHAKSEHVALAAVVPGRHFVEAHIPMRDEAGGVMGVVEFCKSPATLQDMIERGRAMLRPVVRDTGRGISPETLAPVASPFFTTRTRGLGLGLVLAERIVGRFAGRFAIDSEVGRGTRVVFEFAARS